MKEKEERMIKSEAEKGKTVVVATDDESSVQRSCSPTSGEAKASPDSSPLNGAFTSTLRFCESPVSLLWDPHPTKKRSPGPNYKREHNAAMTLLFMSGSKTQQKLRYRDPKIMPRDTLRILLRLINGFEGATHINCLMEKVLTVNDVNKSLGRLAFDSPELSSCLTENEKKFIEECKGRKNIGKGLAVHGVNERGETFDFLLKKWIAYNKGNGDDSYVLTKNWKKLIQDLPVGFRWKVQLWCFRFKETLHFAFIFNQTN